MNLKKKLTVLLFFFGSIVAQGAEVYKKDLHTNLNFSNDAAGFIVQVQDTVAVKTDSIHQ